MFNVFVLRDKEIEPAISYVVWSSIDFMVSNF